ncbi:MAG: AAA family ATPase [Candidatus Aenigmarchaeota archaeon]|nr:AAA family ATPase [Candidatus Aenigmarchaeota archaeon]
MTRITKLEMMGFKSFFKKTTVLFPDNFAVVCGPNGSGKSNILDSICFVLGRSSAKSLRAKRMLQMIYSGKGSKAEFAKVALHFDNSKKEFPLDEESVCVSRKVNRKGISIYKLNGKTVTREKILEVLRKVHVHPDGHNIILQGDITEIIEMSDVERREIIDEISGIEEFEEKRDKAQRELTTVEDRLSKTGIILSEKDNRMRVLEQEKVSAEKYEKLTKELDNFRGSLATKRMEQAEDALKTLDGKIKEREDGFEKFNDDLLKSEKELEEEQKKLQKTAERLFHRDKDVEIIKEMQKINFEIKGKENAIDSRKIDIRRINDMIARLGEMGDRGSKSAAVQAVLRLKKEGVYGNIAALSKVDKKYQTAIEVAAGPHANDIVVDNTGTAVECVNFLKENKIGRAVFLPLDKIQKRYFTKKHLLKEKGVVGLAIELIKFDQKYYNAFSFVLGETLVVDKIETAKRIGIGEIRYVTLDGDLIERSGAIIGGFYRKKKDVFSSSEDIKKYEDEKIKIESEIAFLERDILKLKKELEKVASKEKRSVEEIEKAQEEKKNLEERLIELGKKRRNVTERRAHVQDEIQKLKVSKARLEAEFENIKAEFSENKYKKIKLEHSIPVLQGKIIEIREEIRKLGAINQKAVEEYKELKVVYDDIRGKVETLSSEREKVLGMIMEIEGKRKENFMRTLGAVSEYFKKVFHDLTGGEGMLRLEGETLEDSGLVIEASPKGKALLNIDAMSGGEKTLTALAFLFAIQQFSPAPFYILDEIDAALDKPNTKKITDLIMKYSALAQFIVITHNDMTIKQADTVYGVSMEDGITKLVGIRMP